MNYRRLGKAGIKVSEISFGAWVTFGAQVSEQVAEDCMRVAYDAGVNFFDNAESYAGSRAETVMGSILKKMGWGRESYLVSTKLFWGLHDRVNMKQTLNRKYLLQAIDGSLKRLELDFVDLLFCHRNDPETPIEETVWAMHNIIEQGKAIYWGTSEWSAAEIMEACSIADRHHLHRPVAEQPQYNLLVRDRFEKEYARVFHDVGYGAVTWSPLASGVLSGKYKHGIPEGSRATQQGLEWLRGIAFAPARIEKVQHLEPIANDLNCTLSQLAIAWCLKNPHVSSVITGATRVEQLKENLKSLEVVPKLTHDVMERIEGVLGNKPS